MQGNAVPASPYGTPGLTVLGNVNGSLAVGAVGSTAGTGTLEDIKAFLRAHGALTLDKDELLAKL